MEVGARIQRLSDLVRAISGWRSPPLVIHGNRDASVPLELGRRTAAAIKGARLSVYDGAPHGLFLSHSARLNEELIAFARS